jgi:hypothetical protein
MRHNDFFYPDRSDDMPVMKEPPNPDKILAQKSQIAARNAIVIRGQQLPPIIVVRMHPFIRPDLALHRHPDHVHGGAYRPFLHDRHFSARVFQ